MERSPWSMWGGGCLFAWSLGLSVLVFWLFLVRQRTIALEGLCTYSSETVHGTEWLLLGSEWLTSLSLCQAGAEKVCALKKSAILNIGLLNEGWILLSKEGCVWDPTTPEAPAFAARALQLWGCWREVISVSLTISGLQLNKLISGCSRGKVSEAGLILLLSWGFKGWSPCRVRGERSCNEEGASATKDLKK